MPQSIRLGQPIAISMAAHLSPLNRTRNDEQVDGLIISVMAHELEPIPTGSPGPWLVSATEMHVKLVRIALALLSGWALCGCAAVPPRLEVPASVVGVVSQPVFTGWFRDYCQGGRLVDSTPDCLQHGGEVYRATLLDARTESGAPLARKLVIAFPAHALSRAYSRRKRIELVAAPDPFAAATGIVYLAHVWNEP